MSESAAAQEAETASKPSKLEQIRTKVRQGYPDLSGIPNLDKSVFRLSMFWLSSKEMSAWCHFSDEFKSVIWKVRQELGTLRGYTPDELARRCIGAATLQRDAAGERNRPREVTPPLPVSVC